MIDTATLAHEAVFEICGREYAFPRDLDHLRRAEQTVGAVAPFAARLDARAARSDEIARLYGAFLRDVPGAPTQSEIDAWVFAQGLQHRAFAAYLYTLTLGSEELERVAKARGLNAEKSPGAEPPRGPFAQTAWPTGMSSSDTGAVSDGPRPRPTPVHFTR